MMKYKDFIKKYKLDDLSNEDRIKDEIDTLKEIDIKRMIKFIETEEKENPYFSFSFTYGKPAVAASRPRTTAIVDKDKRFKGIHVYQIARDKEFKVDFRNSLLYELENDENGKEKILDIIKGEFHLTAKIYKKLPKNTAKYKLILAEHGYIRPTTRPDTDNYAKLILDSLMGYLYLDDSQNVNLNIEKFYSVHPRVEVEVKFKKRDARL